MKTSVYTAVLLLVTLLAACTHPTDINGSGDIVSASGDRDCLLEDAPCAPVIIGDYLETYTAIPRDGFEFTGWSGCQSADAEACSFNVSAAVTNQYWFQAGFPFAANFAALCQDAPATTFAAIQRELFIEPNCATSLCHSPSGAADAGNLSLTDALAFDQLVDVDATKVALKRVLPGDAQSSYLYLSLLAKKPGQRDVIPGDALPMPSIGSALTDNQLRALELWINAGAPQTGRASLDNQIEQLLGLCGPG